jgi:hypothetical protein
MSSDYSDSGESDASDDEGSDGEFDEDDMFGISASKLPKSKSMLLSKSRPTACAVSITGLGRVQAVDFVKAQHAAMHCCALVMDGEVKHTKQTWPKTNGVLPPF